MGSLFCILPWTLILHIAACICILAAFLYVAFLRTSIFHLFFPCISSYFLHSFLLYLNLLSTADSLAHYLRIRSSLGLYCLCSLFLRNQIRTAGCCLLLPHRSLPCLQGIPSLRTCACCRLPLRTHSCCRCALWTALWTHSR